MFNDEVHLLLELDDEHTITRRREAAFLSVIFHLVVVIYLVVEPKFFPSARPAVVEPKQIHKQLTYLAQPPPEIKPAPRVAVKPPVLPNKDRLALLKKSETVPLPPPASPTPETRNSTPAPKALPAAPTPNIQQPTPPLFPTPDTQNPAPAAKLPLPQSSAGKSLEDTLRGMAHDRSGGATVHDPNMGRTSPQNPAAIGGAQILSDTQGVDFNPYLQRVLWNIRNNWYAVMPEIARMGKKGRVIIQFEIVKDGSVPRMYLTGPSGSEPFDRAAMAGISASSPFQPLPAEFHGPLLRLQITFLYNIQLE